MDNLYSKFKERRLALGFSVETVVEKTKLHPSVIHDIEAGRINKINPIYIKGFIKIYASFLGINVNDLLAHISAEQASPSQKKIKKEKKPAIKPKKQSKIKLTPEQIRLIISIAVGIVVIFLFVSAAKFIVTKIKNKKAPSVPASVSEPDKLPEKKQPAPVKPRAESVPVIQNTASQKKELTASLTADRDCFLRVKVDSKVLFEGVLRKGAVETWTGNEMIEFKISDGSAVQIEVNGEAIRPLTNMRKPIKNVKITPSGITVDK
ncbi:MAG: DUF4115 domain-containing protein [Candidatus Omnitrophica bacterium]|nr:DUF4115 domain-containing protein [Candidatus Omnitrophota bacterium]